MLQTMKKKAIKRAATIATILFIVGAVLLGIVFKNSNGLFGSKDIYSAKISEIRDAEYATLNIDKYNLYGIFTEEYETKNGIKTNTTDYYCLVLVGDENDDMRYMAVKVPAKYKDKLDKIEEEYTDLDNGVDSDDHTVIKIKGKLVKMNTTGELYGYFKDFVLEYEFESEDIPFVTLNLCLEPRSLSTAVVFLAVAIILILIGVLLIVKAVITGGASRIKKKMETMNAADVEHLEYDFQSAYKVNKSYYIGKEFTYILSGSNGDLVINRDIIWAYLNTIDHRRNGIHVGTSYNIILTDINKRTYTVAVDNENVAQDVLKRYSEISNRIVIGYDAELKTMINRDFNAFLNIAYNRVEEPAYEQYNDEN